tara:strand:- start:12086 stop:14452 length:2367 start_codon:yes stop_codon:yes gene_type:complete
MNNFINSKNNKLYLEKSLPKQLFLLPIIDKPFFPMQYAQIIIDDSSTKKTIEKINQQKISYAGIVLNNSSDDNSQINKKEFEKIGTLVKIKDIVPYDDQYQATAIGLYRFRIKKWINSKSPYLVEVEYIIDDLELYNLTEIQVYTNTILSILKSFIPINPIYYEQVKLFLHDEKCYSPTNLADFSVSITTFENDELQNFLNEINVIKRLKICIDILKRELEVVKIKDTVKYEIKNKLLEHNREFFLKEILKSIQTELGIYKDDRSADIDNFKNKIPALNIPEKLLHKINEELNKLSILEPGSPDYMITRSYLDVVSSLPWNKYSKDKTNLNLAKKILNQDHEGLDYIKNRILEFIAVRSLKGEIAGSILLLVGPPGVGKTSIGKSIAKALNRKFFRFSVGGMRDEAEIKGHRRTYIGAMPGKIIQALIDVQTANPVIMLDEIDKIGASYQGDPAASLLEVLDSEQNFDFLDHYLDLRFDLSKVLFICTANQIDTIPQALSDRMEILRLSGYITDEKIEIAKKHLLPKLISILGLKENQITISDASLKFIIDGYARESGVRSLEHKLLEILRRIVMQYVKNKNKKHFSITVKNIPNYLGDPIFQDEQQLYGIGIVTGLAWTTMGGETLTIEASKIHTNKRGFRITGNLGDVMRESAEIAISYISANIKKYNIPYDFFENSLIHLHVPEGATPKDGPSAGITMATALLSLALNKPIKKHIAMTGEITLTGHILGVGGVREKIIAARRVKVKEIILPESVKVDFKELPSYLKAKIKVHYVSHFNEIIKLIF